MSTDTSAEHRIWTPANLVTMTRILFIPVFMVASLADISWYGSTGVVGRAWTAGAIFLLLSLTDGIDGYLARSRNEVSTFGKLIDPIADKVLVMAAFLVLVQQDVTPAWMALVVVTREFLVSGLRMLAASRSLIIAASWSGKAKTMTTIIALALCLLTPAFSQLAPGYATTFHAIALVIMWLAILLTIASGVEYFVKCRSVFAAPVQIASPKSVASPSHGETYDINALSTQVIEVALQHGVCIATAESCTAGMVSAALTSVPGSSAVVNGGIVSYTNDVKHRILGVDHAILADPCCGAVSVECAIQMAQGALTKLDASLAVSVTGMAGPTSNEPNHPVGQVFIGIAQRTDGKVHTSVAELHLKGNRPSIRQQACAQALCALRDALEQGVHPQA